MLLLAGPVIIMYGCIQTVQQLTDVLTLLENTGAFKLHKHVIYTHSGLVDLLSSHLSHSVSVSMGSLCFTLCLFSCYSPSFTERCRKRSLFMACFEAWRPYFRVVWSCTSWLGQGADLISIVTARYPPFARHLAQTKGH